MMFGNEMFQPKTVTSDNSKQGFGDLLYSPLSLLETQIGLHERAMAAFILIIFFARAFVFSRITRMYPDELLTYVQAQLPSTSAVLAALRHGPTAVDAPLHPVLSFLALHLPLPAPLALRVPSFFAFGAMMLSLFVLARRWAPACIALIAMALPMVLPVFDYAIEARPYALVLASAGWAFVFWQRAAEQRNRRLLLLILLFLSLACAILAQYLAPLLLVPFIAAELWRVFRSRTDVGIWVVLILAASLMLIYRPFLPAAAQYRLNVWHGVMLEDLRETYMLGVSPIVVVLLAACVLVYFAASVNKPTREWQTLQCRDYERVAIVTFYFIPVLAFIAAKLVTRSYVPRYALMFSIAAVLLLTALFAILTRGIRAYLVLVLIGLLLPSVHPLVALSYRLPTSLNAISAQSIENLNRFHDLSIALPNWNIYLRIYFFGPADVRSRMVLISNSVAAAAIGNDLNVPTEKDSEFIASHSQFLLIDQSQGMREKLANMGAQLTWIGIVAGEDAFIVKAATHQ